jgi:type I restriction enzyme M protein
MARKKTKKQWFFDRAKPADRKDKVLMLDARNVFRKVTRKINDFSPEQMKNIAAIVWLYRGQNERFSEMNEAFTLYETDRKKLLTSIDSFAGKYCKALPKDNNAQHSARKTFDPIAEAIRDFIKQVDLVYKLAARVTDTGYELAGNETIAESYDRRAVAKLVKKFDEERKSAVEQLKLPPYFHRQIAWLQDRFPKAELQDVAGLVKLVDRKEIEKADWSLTPGRYVGVAPQEEDENFDFEQTMRDIHVELADLNKEAVGLAKRIQGNFEELGI